MFLMDVNVLVYAHRGDTPDHLAYRSKLTPKKMIFPMLIMRP